MKISPQDAAADVRHSTDTVSQITKCLIGRITEPIANISESTSFAELGVDSLSFLELVVDIEQTFGVSLSPDDALDMVTVGDLAAYVERNRVS